MKTLYKSMVAIALVALTTASYAAVRANFTRADEWISFESRALVPLTDNQATTVSFNLPAAGKKVLSYSVWCVAGGPTNSFIDLDIVVNGIIVAPTVGHLDRFCGVDGRSSRPSITLVIQGEEGPNTVKIVAYRNNGATVVSLGASALVVHD